MKTFLNEDIQTAGEAGHSSAEDSFSALKLVLLKLQHDISFGDIDMNPSFEWDGVNYKVNYFSALIRISELKCTSRKYAYHLPRGFHPLTIYEDVAIMTYCPAHVFFLQQALYEAMNIVSNERRRQVIQSSWIRHAPR